MLILLILCCFSSGDPAASDISDQVIQLLQIFQIMLSSCFKYFRSGDPAASDISDQVIQLLHIFQIRWSRGFRYFRSGDPAASVDPVDPVSLVNFLSWPPPPLWHFYHLQITILLKSFNQVRSCKYCSGALCNKGWLNLLRKNKNFIFKQCCRPDPPQTESNSRLRIRNINSDPDQDPSISLKFQIVIKN